MRIVLILCVAFLFSCKNQATSEPENKNAYNKDSNNLDFHDLSRKADSLYYASNYELAVIYFTKLLYMDSCYADAYFKRGYSKAQISKHRESINDYLKAIELNHRKKDALFNIGCDYSALKEFDEALYFYRKAFELDPQNKEIEILISICLENLNLKEI